MALGLTPPWQVVRCDFDAAKKRLDLELDFPKGSLFPCPKCGRSGCKPHDTVQKTGRHLSFFQHEALLSARVPRVDCDNCGIRLVSVPWARPESGFTALFEALLMAMVRAMPVATAARLAGVRDKRLWRILAHHVNKAREQRKKGDVG
jgi:transposase